MFYVTVHLWLIGGWNHNQQWVKRESEFTESERIEYSKKLKKILNLFRAMVGIQTYRHWGKRVLNGNDGWSEPNVSYSFVLKNRHIRRLYPYLKRTFQIMNVHAYFVINDSVTFKHSCDECERTHTNMKEVGFYPRTFICPTCMRSRKLETV